MLSVPLIIARVLWRGLNLGLLLLIGAFVSLILPVWASLHGEALEALRIRAKRWWLERLCRCLKVRLRVDGRPPAQAGLLLANHVSWLDIPVLGALTPCQFLAKAEVARWPLVGWLCRSAGTRFIRRGQGQTAAVRNELGALIDARHAVLIFPEGTTTDGQSVRRFHHQLLGAAGEAPVHPVVLSYWQGYSRCSRTPYIGHDIFVLHLIRLLAQPSILARISFLPPLAARQPRQQARQAEGLIRLGLARHRRSALLALQADEQKRSFYTG